MQIRGLINKFFTTGQAVFGALPAALRRDTLEAANPIKYRDDTLTDVISSAVKSAERQENSRQEQVSLAEPKTEKATRRARRKPSTQVSNKAKVSNRKSSTARKPARAKTAKA